MQGLQHGHPARLLSAPMPLSAAVRAQRAFVSALLAMAKKYGVGLEVRRESLPPDVLKAYRQVAKRAHPDKGGHKADFQRLQAAKEEWERAQSPQPRAQTQRGAAGGGSAIVPATALWSEKGQPGHRVQSGAVILTYFGEWSLRRWQQFLAFVRKQLQAWEVLRWCATLERSDAGRLHVHLALQFRRSIDRPSKCFAWAGRVPNASSNDYLGQGMSKHPQYLQQSVDRAFFYVFADKRGTQKDRAGRACVDGNHFPAWVKAPASTGYHVPGRWPQALWQQHKLDHETYEEYVFLCRDGVLARKRNLDAVRQREEDAAEAAERTATAKRVRRQTFVPFSTVPEVVVWQKAFEREVDRYPLLVLLAPSRSRKTEFAKSLFKAPLELKIGTLEHFPDGMRKFSRREHDAIVLDDCRDFAFLVRHQEKLQGKSDALVEFGSTPGGQLAYTKWLHRVPIVVTANGSTENRHLLDDDYFLGNPETRVLVQREGAF